MCVFGAVDDVWVESPGRAAGPGRLLVVDYKATSKNDEVTIDADWQQSYKRQLEVYQWLLRRQSKLSEAGYSVSDTGYFVYCNGKKDRAAFDGKLEFDIKVIPYTGSDKWVDGTLGEIKKLLDSKAVPAYTDGCEWCGYQQEVMGASKCFF